MKQFSSLFLISLFLLTLKTYAFGIEGKEGMRLIEIGENQRIWVTEEQLDEIDEMRHKFGKLGVGYFDVTDYPEGPKNPFQRPQKVFPTAPSFQEVVMPLLEEIRPENIESAIMQLSKLPNRYYTTSSGVQATKELLAEMQKMALNAGRSDANCSEIPHSWAQGSVLCRLEGEGPSASEIILTGAHLDSINSRSGPNGRAPGADDDASGVAAFVEAWRILLVSGFKPKRSLEFVAYAAEEVGLRGSQDIARMYSARNEDVYAVYQNEMSGYPGRAASIVVLQDFVDSGLTKFVESLIPEYTTLPLERGICGYGCSDHASWTKEGFPAVCTAEAGPFGDVNPYMHTDQDTLDKLDMKVTTQFTRLALAFLVELSLF